MPPFAINCTVLNDPEPTQCHLVCVGHCRNWTTSAAYNPRGQGTNLRSSPIACFSVANRPIAGAALPQSGPCPPAFLVRCWRRRGDDTDACRGEPYSHMSVEENLRFALENQNLPKAEIGARVARAADILQISHLLKRPPNQLSGGQSQRVAIGRAIVEQAGSPVEFYARPANQFVGGFLGAPQMNFLPGTVADAGGNLAIAVDDNRVTFTLPRPSPLAAGSAATIGIRPEHLTLATDGPLAAKVKVTKVSRRGDRGARAAGLRHAPHSGRAWHFRRGAGRHHSPRCGSALHPRFRRAGHGATARSRPGKRTISGSTEAGLGADEEAFSLSGPTEAGAQDLSRPGPSYRHRRFALVRSHRETGGRRWRRRKLRCGHRGALPRCHYGRRWSSVQIGSAFDIPICGPRTSR